MFIRSRIARLIAAPVVAAVTVVGAFGLLYRAPMWLLGLSEPWEYRSTSDHLVADTIGLGLIFLGMVTLPALARVLYLSWSPRPTADAPITRDSVDGWTPNTSLERTREG
jgi:hypothetical protein